MESGCSFIELFVQTKNVCNVLFQNKNKCPHLRFIYHSASPKGTLSQLLMKMTLSGCPWISAAFFLETSVAFFFPFSCLHTTPSGKRKRNDTHLSLIPNSSHPFHLPACGQSFGKGFLLFYLLSQQKNVIIFFVTDYWLYHSSALLKFSCNSWNNKTHLEKITSCFFIARLTQTKAVGAEQFNMQLNIHTVDQLDLYPCIFLLERCGNLHQ